MKSKETNFINLKRVSSWGKFMAVITFICAVFYAIYGLGTLLISFSTEAGLGIGLLVGAFIVPTIVALYVLGVHLWRMAKVAESLARDDRQYEMNDLLYHLGKYLRFSGILVIASFILSFISVFLTVFIFGSLMASL